MSRVAKQILSTEGVEIRQDKRNLYVKGLLGENHLILHKDIEIECNIEDKTLVIKGNADNAIKGTFNRLIGNAISGVKKKFEKKIQLKGVGYKTSIENNKIKLVIGLSHDTIIDIPEGLSATLASLTSIILQSCSKQKLGDFADLICRSKKYNVYKGTGVLDTDKFYRIKATKKK